MYIMFNAKACIYKEFNFILLGNMLVYELFRWLELCFGRSFLEFTCLSLLPMLRVTSVTDWIFLYTISNQSHCVVYLLILIASDLYTANGRWMNVNMELW
jgi:hypothetical protein